MQNETIWDMLNELYEPEEILTFAITPQPDILGGKTPFEALASDDIELYAALGQWLHGCLYQVAT